MGEDVVGVCWVLGVYRIVMSSYFINSFYIVLEFRREIYIGVIDLIVESYEGGKIVFERGID